MRLAALASLSLIASASGDYVSMFVERGNVPTLPGTTTYRIFATFDNPGDKVLAIAGVPVVAPMEFSSTLENGFPGAGLIQHQLVPVDCSTDSLLTNVISLPGDSFLTISAVNDPLTFPAIGDDIGVEANPDLAFVPGVLCNDNPEVPIAGASWTTGDAAGGIFTSNPSGDEETGQAVLIAQFTLADTENFTFRGIVNYTAAGEPGSLDGFFFIDSSVLPASAGCATIGDYLAVLNDGTATDCNNNNILDLCEAGDLNANGLADNCECIADINGDDRVDLEDIVTLLFSWGEPAAGLAVNVDASTAGSENVIDQADLDAVMQAALGTGCEAELIPLTSPASAPVQETRESSSLGKASQSPVRVAVALPVELLGLPLLGSTSERPIPAQPEGTLRTGLAPIELPLKSVTPDKNDAIETLFELLSARASVLKPSEAKVDWDLDGDGLLDPWSVMILPLSSWPEELRPFAELLRP